MPSMLNHRTQDLGKSWGRPTSAPKTPGADHLQARMLLRAVPGHRAANLKQHSGGWQPCGHRPVPIRAQKVLRSQP